PSTGTMACATCVTSAAALTSNGVVIGGGSQASSTISADTTTTHALFATATAPAFRAIVGSDLPNPSSSTLGGIESLALVSHKFISSISTSGVPAATQPACGDLSDAATSCST